MENPFSENSLKKLFKPSSRNSELIGKNEGTTIEYKESFGFASIADYLKAMAAFANRDGGYIIFGIKDRPHKLVGLTDKALSNFNRIDNQLWTTHLREYFAPEIKWGKFIHKIGDKFFGIVYTYPADTKPVICKKDANNTLRKAAIYYRYNSQNSEIDYPELAHIIENEKDKINEKWMKMIKQISEVGVVNSSFLDIKNAKIVGPNSTLYIDENLFNQLVFVQKGSFVENGGNPALKVVGEVQTVVGAQKVIVNTPNNKAVTVDDILKAFITQSKVINPLEFVKLICYQNTGNIPFLYYLYLANVSISDAMNYLEDIPVNSNAKICLKNKLENKDSKFLKLSITGTNASIKKNSYKAMILENKLMVPKEVTEIKYCLLAIRGMHKDEVINNKKYILSVLDEIYLNFFNSPSHATIKSEFRYALCWVDEALYFDLVSKNVDMN